MTTHLENLDLLTLYKGMNAEHLGHFEPYERQRDVIEATKHAPVTWMSSCNGAGKTALGAMINIWHWTGEYPDDYQGRRMEECGEYWVLAPSALLLKNAIQTQLFLDGTFSEIKADLELDGLGWSNTDPTRGGKMPKRCIISIEKATHYTEKDAYVATMKVRHVSGGINTVKFYHYELGAKKLAGKHNVLFWHCDEVPPEDIFTELKARQGTNKIGIFGLITATPERFADQEMIRDAFSEEWIEKGNARVVVDIMDVPLRVMPTRQQKIDDCSPKNAPAKLHGLPMNGAMFFSLQPEMFTISHSDWIDKKRQGSWARINGMDFGFNDDTAIAQLWTDITSGTTVLVKSFKKPEMSPPEFATAARASGIEIDEPTAWPHDGMRRDGDMTTIRQGRDSKTTKAQFYKLSLIHI